MQIGIVGCGGRMGRILMTTVLDHEDCTLSGGTERAGSPLLGQDIGLMLGRAPLDLAVTDHPAALFAKSDVVIDFTSPAATRAHAQLAVQHNTALVVGTTGLSAEDETLLQQAAAVVPVVYAPNYSIGVTVLTVLVEQAASVLRNDYDAEIVEMHHRNKVDSPSGTALGLGRAVARGREVALDQHWCKSRDGHTGVRPRGEIGFATLRGGDVVGDHSVIFAGEGERLELTHKASSRAVFAQGAVRAARWAVGQSAGLYGMRDVLGL